MFSSAALKLALLSDSYDGPKYLREAIYRFLISVAQTNLSHPNAEKNYSMLIHTSGKRIDHKADKGPVDDVFHGLADLDSTSFVKHASRIKEIAAETYGESTADIFLDYIVRNRTKYNLIIMNSERDKNVEFKSATSPAALFTIIIGGNIVSRGVTFNNLLSMFFTRDAKHKIQQDTYIQRARMFGSRKAELPYFELTIPEHLYLDWHRCFIFHKLALEAIKANLGSPVWLSDQRIAAAAGASIDRANVSMDRGEMSFSLFQYTPDIEKIIDSCPSPLSILRAIQDKIGQEALPHYLIRYLEQTAVNKAEVIGIHPSSSIGTYKSLDSSEKEKVQRRRGFFGKSQLEEKGLGGAIHHIKIFYNGTHNARIFYKFSGNISFIKNLKNV